MNLPFDITRRDVKKNIGDGKYKGRISLIFGKKWSGQNYLVLQVDIEDNGERVELYFNIPFKWYEAGKLVKTLRKLDNLPEKGEQLDIDKLKNMNVIVEVKNTYKNGEEYSNIVDIEKLEEDFEEIQDKSIQEVKKKPKFPKKPVKKNNIQRKVLKEDNEDSLEEDRLLED
ncbi:MAG: hypothetical protein N4A48_12310 [Tepidibacter sp.]|jgi:hypothetical protein|uniref:hypothetical protein n=1 Tax=Tepidibacter sp. TaxID=2529387 RepID=UPI0025E4CE0E|nr:hypothetical protein [Tepidibacter sp.]MCT4509513.1 hypothetical protein [Tepidibacter sp.]